jgi:glycosyltransferase involved in cell wall biosynthesis
MKMTIVSDAWSPQVNGVVTTLQNTIGVLRELGHEVGTITPDQFRSVPCPGYREIRLSVLPREPVARVLDNMHSDAIHIATEGPLGYAARHWCIKNQFAFATSYHTRFPEYIRMRAPVPLSMTYSYLRRFHNAGHHTLVRTKTQKRLLEEKRFEHLGIWPGAVDIDCFTPRGKDALSLPRPVSLYMGRIAVEKGLDEFLNLDLPGTKVVIGGGPDLDKLRKRYPEAVFTGPKYGLELAGLVSAADVFVFPSRTDTLGLVMLEAMACGVPVAAFPVPGPADMLIEGCTGALDEDLRAAVFRALRLDGDACVEFAREHSWHRSTQTFLSYQRCGHNADERLAAGLRAG